MVFLLAWILRLSLSRTYRQQYGRHCPPHVMCVPHLTHEQLMILLVLSHKGEEVTSTEAVLNNRSITAVSDIEL